MGDIAEADRLFRQYQSQINPLLPDDLLLAGALPRHKTKAKPLTNMKRNCVPISPIQMNCNPLPQEAANNDETKKSADKKTQQTGESALELTMALGRELRLLREQKGLSIKEVAARLKLPARQIETLEQGQYAGLPEPVFVRGFAQLWAFWT